MSAIKADNGPLLLCYVKYKGEVPYSPGKRLCAVKEGDHVVLQRPDGLALHELTEIGPVLMVRRTSADGSIFFKDEAMRIERFKELLCEHRPQFGN